MGFSLNLTKRRKIIITAVLLSLGLVVIQAEVVAQRYLAIFSLTVVCYLFSAWALKKELKGIEWLTALILPCFFTLGIGFFYFLLPRKWTTGVPVVVLYAFGIYIILLTENIFSVASARSIQLRRAAQATGFLMTLITAFFLFDTVYSFRLFFGWNFFAIFILSFFLILQGLWSVALTEKISLELIFESLILALVLAETALVVSFWPLTVSTTSLFLITVLYILLGLMQSNLQKRLFKKTIREYLFIGLIVFLTIFFTTSWSG